MKLKTFIKCLWGSEPAAFRRLCVETWPVRQSDHEFKAPAAFRRLCVETVWVMFAVVFVTASRLQAAVC